MRVLSPFEIFVETEHDRDGNILYTRQYPVDRWASAPKRLARVSFAYCRIEQSEHRKKSTVTSKATIPHNDIVEQSRYVVTSLRLAYYAIACTDRHAPLNAAANPRKRARAYLSTLLFLKLTIPFSKVASSLITTRLLTLYLRTGTPPCNDHRTRCWTQRPSTTRTNVHHVTCNERAYEQQENVLLRSAFPDRLKRSHASRPIYPHQAAPYYPGF